MKRLIKVRSHLRKGRLVRAHLRPIDITFEPRIRGEEAVRLAEMHGRRVLGTDYGRVVWLGKYTPEGYKVFHIERKSRSIDAPLDLPTPSFEGSMFQKRSKLHYQRKREDSE